MTPAQTICRALKHSSIWHDGPVSGPELHAVFRKTHAGFGVRNVERLILRLVQMDVIRKGRPPIDPDQFGETYELNPALRDWSAGAFHAVLNPLDDEGLPPDGYRVDDDGIAVKL